MMTTSNSPSDLVDPAGQTRSRVKKMGFFILLCFAYILAAVSLTHMILSSAPEYFNAGPVNDRKLQANPVRKVEVEESNISDLVTLLSSGIISTVAGNGDYFITTGSTGDGGQATLATLGYPKGVAVDASGNIYIADTLSNRIRMVTKSTGIITTVAGSGQSGSSPGTSGYSGDGGQATSATLSNPDGVALDASGNIYIADTDNNRIRMVMKSTGIISTVAGKGGFYGYSGDGRQATSAALAYPSGVAIDASGNIYIADSRNNCIRLVTKSTGIISTVAGKGEKYGYSGDGGQATLADLYFPHSLAVDASGNIYIADTRNDRIRMVTKSTGIITTVVGTGQFGSGGDEGPATLAFLSDPNGVALDASGNIYIADSNNNRIRMVTKSTGIISTIAGSKAGTYSGDGEQATSALVNSPNGVAVDTSGTLYIADSGNNRIRIIGESAPPSVPITPSSPTPSPFPSSPVASPSPSSPVTPASPSSPSAALVASACAGNVDTASGMAAGLACAAAMVFLAL